MDTSSLCPHSGAYFPSLIINHGRQNMIYIDWGYDCTILAARLQPTPGGTILHLTTRATLPGGTVPDVVLLNTPHRRARYKARTLERFLGAPSEFGLRGVRVARSELPPMTVARVRACSYALPVGESFLRYVVFFHVGHSVLIEEGEGYGHSLSSEPRSPDPIFSNGSTQIWTSFFVRFAHRIAFHIQIVAQSVRYVCATLGRYHASS